MGNCEKCGKKIFISFSKNDKSYCRSCYKELNNLEKGRGRQLLENPKIIFEEVLAEEVPNEKDEKNPVLSSESKKNYDEMYPKGVLYYSGGKRIKREDFIKNEKEQDKKFEAQRKKENLYPIQIKFLDNSFTKYEIKKLDEKRKLTKDELKRLDSAILPQVAFAREMSLQLINDGAESIMKRIKEDIKTFSSIGAGFLPTAKLHKDNFRSILNQSRKVLAWINLNAPKNTIDFNKKVIIDDKGNERKMTKKEIEKYSKEFKEISSE